ncbi:MAG TPA: Gfo/Idh/MocA family oxidoreductase [Acidobacteriota bacterium]|nr:Gfo/Idh/MocA family oxidoreductase [Acidobacteriota bacterium]
MRKAAKSPSSNIPRRQFIKDSSLLAAGLAAGFPSILARPQETIRVGLVGCGGRGTGAVLNVLQAKTEVIYPPPRQGYHTENAAPGATARAQNVEVVALADLFRDRLEQCRAQLKKVGTEIPENRCFVGFNAYQELISLPEINYVLLASPPYFRPAEFMAAVEAGKHVFLEKPIAVDAPGVRSVMEAGKLAEKKGLAVGAGTVRRHRLDQIETIKRIHDGAIGDIREARAYFNIGEIWMIPREPGWNDVEWHIRNWPYFVWLSGDIIVEQHVHTLDMMNWAKNAHPVRAYGLGGRLARPSEEYGNIYDHFAIEYEYADGTRLYSQNRQIDGGTSRVGGTVVGTRGESNCENVITGDREWRYQGEVPDPYEQSHIHVIESIRAGKPINESQAIAESTLTAIMGREAAYTGQVIEWDQAFNSKMKLGPERLEFGDIEFPAVPMPKNHKFF